MEQKTLLFTDQKIKEMIIPLFLEQLLLFSVGFSVVIMLFVLVGNRWMLQLLFGKVEAPVMDACVTYLRISAYSYPALAIYNAGAAVYRSLGKTNVTIGNLAGTDPQCFQCDSISFFGCQASASSTTRTTMAGSNAGASTAKRVGVTPIS